jgi:hypothetical protein
MRICSPRECEKLAVSSVHLMDLVSPHANILENPSLHTPCHDVCFTQNEVALHPIQELRISKAGLGEMISA